MASRQKRQEEGAARIPANLLKEVLAEHGDWYGLRMILIGNYYSGAPFAALVKKFGMLRDDFAILGYLSDYGEMTANVIVAMSGRPKNSISRGVIKLTASKLIEAKASTEDRRYVQLSVTPAGRALYEEAMLIFRAREQEMFGCLSATEMQNLDKLLSKILSHWHQRKD